MPWRISENKEDGTFCVVAKSDGKVVKCHPTRKEANSHIAALYVNEPSTAKKSVGYGMLKSLIEERVEEIKACGANKPGGGGFTSGNTCARGGGSKSGKEVYGTEAKKGDEVKVISGHRKGAIGVLTTGGFARESYDVKFKDSKFPERISVDKLVYKTIM